MKPTQMPSWYEVQANLRGSGRTTRMLKQAANEARLGRAVYVVSYDSEQVMKLRNKYMEICGIVVPATAFVYRSKEARGFVRFRTHDGFDYAAMKFATTKSSDVVFVDHAAIEKRFSSHVRNASYV